jgi:hypothetical protein
MTEIKHLSDIEREAKRQKKIKHLEVKLKQLKADEKKQEKKQRIRELIEIGNFLCQFHDRKELLEYFRSKPQYITVSEEDTNKNVIVDTWDKNKPTTVFIGLNTAPKKN